MKLEKKLDLIFAEKFSFAVLRTLKIQIFFAIRKT